MAAVSRLLLVKSGLNLIGTPYIWGGKDPIKDKGLDCSGFYTHLLWQLLKIDLRQTHNANELMKRFKAIGVDEVKAGDAVFYGRPAANGRPAYATHIMMVLYKPLATFIPGMVVGACGGSSATKSPTPHAKVQVRGAVRYRDPDDFLGYGSVSEFVVDK